eukprot:15365741-Ditylum_brightwellii.AAC.1
MDEIRNDDATGGNDIDKPEPTRYRTSARRSPMLFDPANFLNMTQKSKRYCVLKTMTPKYDPDALTYWQAM